MKKCIALLVAIILGIFTLCACTESDTKETDTLVGKWYNPDNRCLDIRSDGTYKLEDAYGTGKWKYLDDAITIEFTDFYGDTQESKINEDEQGQYIDFGFLKSY